MKIKNKTIAMLYLAGCAKITATSLGSEDDYKIIRFRREIARAFAALSAEEQALVAECGLKAGEKGDLIGDEASLKRFTEMRGKLSEDVSEIEVRTITFDAWHALKKENGKLATAEVEDALENVLWKTVKSKK